MDSWFSDVWIMSSGFFGGCSVCQMPPCGVVFLLSLEVEEEAETLACGWVTMQLCSCSQGWGLSIPRKVMDQHIRGTRVWKTRASIEGLRRDLRCILGILRKGKGFVLAAYESKYRVEPRFPHSDPSLSPPEHSRLFSGIATYSSPIACPYFQQSLWEPLMVRRGGWLRIILLAECGLETEKKGEQRLELRLR